MGHVLPGNGAPLVDNTVVATAPVPTGTALFQFTATSDINTPPPGKVANPPPPPTPGATKKMINFVFNWLTVT